MEEIANGAFAAQTFIVTPCQNQTLCHTLFYGRGRNRPSDILFLRGTIFSSTRRAGNRLFVLWKCQKHRLFCNFIFGACSIFRSTPFSCTRRAADRPPPHKPYAGHTLARLLSRFGLGWWCGGGFSISRGPSGATHKACGMTVDRCGVVSLLGSPGTTQEA